MDIIHNPCNGRDSDYIVSGRDEFIELKTGQRQFEPNVQAWPATVRGPANVALYPGIPAVSSGPACSDGRLFCISRNAAAQYTIERSLDHGETWSTVKVIPASAVTGYHIICNGPHILYVDHYSTTVNKYIVSHNYGDTWSEPVSLTVTSSNPSVAYGNGRFVIVNASKAFVSTDNGDTFTEYAIDTAPYVASYATRLFFGNNMFVAAFYSTTSYTFMCYSTDGTSWTRSPGSVGSPASTGGWVYANGYYVLAHSLAGYISRSTDGYNWTNVTIPKAVVVSRIVSNGSRVVIAAGAGTGGVIYTSDDGGATWDTRTPPTFGASGVTDADYVNGQFVLVSQHTGVGAYVHSSTDGTTWTSTNTPAANTTSITYGEGLWTAVTTAGAIYTSPDLAAWTIRTASPTGFNAATRVRYLNGTFFAVSNGYGIVRSADGLTWERIVKTGTMYNIGYVGGALFLITSVDIQYSQDNGDTWATALTIAVYSGAIGNGRLLVCGTGGLVSISSIDDIRVHPSRWVAYGQHHRLVFNGTKFFVLHSSMVTHTEKGYGFIYSTDGINWLPVWPTVAEHEAKYRAFDVTRGFVSAGSKLVAVPDGDLVTALPDNYKWHVYVSEDDGATWTPRFWPREGGISFSNTMATDGTYFYYDRYGRLANRVPVSLTDTSIDPFGQPGSQLGSHVMPSFTQSMPDVPVGICRYNTATSKLESMPAQLAFAKMFDIDRATGDMYAVRLIDTNYSYHVFHDGEPALLLKYTAATQTWSNIAPGTYWHNTASHGATFLKFAPDGLLYFSCAQAVTISGLTGKLFSYNPVTTAWALLSGTYAFCMDWDADGTIYLGGANSTVGGVTSTFHKKVAGGSWALGMPASPNNSVMTMQVNSATDIYIGGQFTTVNGDACSYLARWDGTVWAAPKATNPAAAPYVLAVDSSDNIFYRAGSTQVIYTHNGTEWVAQAFPTGGYLTLQLNNSFLYLSGFGMRKGPDGAVYLCGGVATAGNAYHTGNVFRINPTTKVMSTYISEGSEPINGIAWDGSNVPYICRTLGNRFNETWQLSFWFKSSHTFTARTLLSSAALYVTIPTAGLTFSIQQGYTTVFNHDLSGTLSANTWRYATFRVDATRVQLYIDAALTGELTGRSNTPGPVAGQRIIVDAHTWHGSEICDIELCRGYWKPIEIPTRPLA